MRPLDPYKMVCLLVTEIDTQNNNQEFTKVTTMMSRQKVAHLQFSILTADYILKLSLR